MVHVTPQDAVKIEAYREDIQAAGFDIEPFGDDAYQIRAVPNVLGGAADKERFSGYGGSSGGTPRAFNCAEAARCDSANGVQKSG